MPERILTTRELNRTHLHRQHLLNRANLSVGDMLCALAGLQAQEVKDPYLALWSRLETFCHADLGSTLLDRSVVRASLMRGTIHLVTADDYLETFPVTYSLHQRAVHSVHLAKLVPADHHEAIAKQANHLLLQQPLTASQVGEQLAESWPDYDRQSLGQVVRFLLPLIQTPPRGVWGAEMHQNARWALAGDWLKTEPATEPGQPESFVRRYLRAFGPASVADLTAWGGVTNLKPILLAMRDELVIYRNEAGKTLYDLVGMEIMSASTDAPARLLPGFDNALLGHKDRTRIISDAHRAIIGTRNGLFSSTFLVDGFVAGVWRLFAGRLELAAFSEISKHEREDVECEAEQLAPFWTGEDLPFAWVDLWDLPGKRVGR